MLPSVNIDPGTVNDASPTATVGQLYVYNSDGGTAPRGVYRYVQIKDIAGADGYCYCPDETDLDAFETATADRSADALSTVCVGVGVGTVTADYYTYILVNGVHDNVLGDGSVAAGDALYPHASTDGAADTRAETVASAQFGTALTADDSSNRFYALINCL